MKLIKQIIPIAIIITLMTSCASSRIVLSSNADVSKYKYVIFGSESSGDRELDDIIMAVQNQIAETNLKVLSTSNISRYWSVLIAFLRLISMLLLKNGMEDIHILQ